MVAPRGGVRSPRLPVTQKIAGSSPAAGTKRAYPLLVILDERARLRAAARSATSGAERRDISERLAACEARERVALDDLRGLIARYEIRQDTVARSMRVDRTMVNKVWNSGRPGRERQWIRSRRIIEATYRALALAEQARQTLVPARS